MLRFACVVSVLIACAVASGDEPGHDEALARAHYTLGLAYYDGGQFVEAVAEFEKAYALTHRPALLYNLAKAYDHAGNAVKARSLYTRYLAAGDPAAKERTEVEARQLALEAQVGRVRVPSLCDPVEARVDGQRVDGGTLRDGLEVMPGSHIVDLFRPGYASARQTVSVAAGASAELGVALVPASRGYPIHKKWWFWTIAGAVVTGAVLTGVFVSRRDEGPSGIVLPTPR